MGDETRFAPGERHSKDLILEQYNKIMEHTCSSCFDFFPLPLLVVNSKRQIILSNKAFMQTLGVDDVSTFLGQRPGETLGCVYVATGTHGCGTDEHCSQCGAVLAMLDSIENEFPSEHECQLLMDTAEGIQARDFRVYAAPWEVGGDTHHVISLADISDQKRREVLERVFFHDLLNSVSGAQGLTRLVIEDATGEMKELLKLLDSTLLGLAEEIHKQRDMVALENGEYVVNPITLQASEVVESIAEEFRAHKLALGKEIEFDTASERIEVMADYVLLRRVVVNMLINALEATPEGGTVKMGVKRSEAAARLWVYNEAVMPDSVRLQVFKRSFSTKGQGRGLGTYSVKMLTENHLKGKADFSSTNEGTTFWIELPEKNVCKIPVGR